MLSDFLSVLKFLTDSQTRDTIKAISQVASHKQSDWKKNVYSMREQFKISEWVKINAFSNDLFQRIKNTGISESKFQRFTTIYSELVDNAYNHGCGGKNNCKVTIQCLFSKWFIQLEVADDGRGFDLKKVLQKVDDERADSRIRHGQSGIELILELSDSVEVKKSRVLVVIAGEDRIKIKTTVVGLEKREMCIVTIEEDEQWSFLSPSWEPLRDTLETITQPLILVRFGKPTTMKDEGPALPQKFYPMDSSGVMGVTKPRRKAKPIITECALDKNHYFAYVTPERWVYDDLKKLENSDDDENDIKNLRFFRNENDAISWLKECPTSEIPTT